MYNRLANNKRLLFSLTLVLAASLLVPSHLFPSAHAQFTGLVCITTSTSATSCPTSAPTLGPFVAGQTFTIGVFIQGSDAMGGLDIYVRSDPAFVSPSSAALGPLIASPSLTSICVNGSAQTGSCTVGTANGPGVVEVTTIESSGGNECGGISPCSGMAFTITYSVVGATPSTTLSYPTAAGCSTSSVTSPPNVCVLVADSTGTTLPENIQGATVTITLPPAVVCITYPTTATSCPVGAPDIPVTFGSTVTIGVFVQNSQPLGGFDIYVSADPNYLNPTSAALGTLITSPSVTSICVDGSAQLGSCGAANGPSVVEVSTIESSGGDDPGTGLAFSITYQVVGVTPSSPISYPTNRDCFVSSVSSPPNTCVLVADNVGTTLPENVQGANVVQTHAVDPTMIRITCVPNPIGLAVGNLTACSGIVSDTAASGKVPPKGRVTFQTAGFGSFNPTSCDLSAMNATTSFCQTNYQPLGVGVLIHGFGITNITVLYFGDTIHRGGTFSGLLQVKPAQTGIQTVLINKQTGFPLSLTGDTVPLGVPVFDRVFEGFLLGGFGFNGGLGVFGTVTYTLYPNSYCRAGTGTVISTVTVGSSNKVPDSASVTPAVGLHSFNAFYHNVTTDNLPSTPVTSPCEPFTVTPAPPTVSVSKFFTDSTLSPLPLDNHGNPMVNVVLARTVVESTNPGQVLAWVNVTNTGSTSLQSLKLNETLPVDWTVTPSWLTGKGAIHVYFANTISLATNLEITQPSTITVTTGNPEVVQVAISSLNATAIGHPLMPGQSILLSVKLTYGLIKTSQSFASYPRNYADIASAAAWTLPSYTGAKASATGSAFFTAYAKVVGDPGQDTPIIDVSKYAIV